MKDLKALLLPVIERAQEYSLVRMNSFSIDTTTSLTGLEGQVNTFPVTAQILVAGLELEIVFRMHFALPTVKNILAQRESFEAPTDDLALDFMREYCNVVSGQIKAILDLCDISLAHGLPFVAAELSASLTPSDNANRLTTCWQIENDQSGTIGCSLLIEIKEQAVWDKLARVETVEKDLAPSGEVELF